MRFNITESEKNEIRGLYNLNEQNFIDALFKGSESGKKSFVLSNNTFKIGFHNGKRGHDNITEKAVELLLQAGPNFIEGDGNTVKVKMKRQRGEGKEFYNIIYNCSKDELTRDDGYKVWNGGDVGNDDVEDLKNELKKFCDV